jgi:protein-S-isoprenylcysteine O-methyltransferase Ste14
MGELAKLNAMRQLAAWLGGGVFVAALALCAWWYLVTLGRSLPFQGWPPVLFDVALFTIFALHHSVLARERVKASLRRFIPDALSRTVYVWTASVLLIAMCLLWRPVGGDLYNATGWALWAHSMVQLSGIWLIARATAAIDPLELAGIRQASSAVASKQPQNGGLQITGPYHWVRHPLYLGWVLAVFGHAHMTGDRALFAVITTTYLVAAVPLEERSLVASFGDDYRRYQREVRWRIVPYVF